ncbi:thrombomodulin-like [Haliotis rufescens]|uniref:thrombomodulin-like n=1 Tax=Haliotis rufescens TaxID=6454 RepID=UPI001EB05440|nr:thrombomodulin-like [Haliotis rufescens]
MHSLYSILAIVFTVYMQPTSAQALCDTVGCLNGACVLPPTVVVPTCNCTAGFQLTLTDPNVCINIDECYYFNYLCGVSYEPYLRRYVSSGRCVDKPGSYECTCNPNVALPSFDNKTCFPLPFQQPQQQQQQQQLQQQQFYQRLISTLLLTQSEL